MMEPDTASEGEMKERMERRTREEGRDVEKNSKDRRMGNREGSEREINVKDGLFRRKEKNWRRKRIIGVEYSKHRII